MSFLSKCLPEDYEGKHMNPQTLVQLARDGRSAVADTDVVWIPQNFQNTIHARYHDDVVERDRGPAASQHSQPSTITPGTSPEITHPSSRNSSTTNSVPSPRRTGNGSNAAVTETGAGRVMRNWRGRPAVRKNRRPASSVTKLTREAAANGGMFRRRRRPSMRPGMRKAMAAAQVAA